MGSEERQSAEYGRTLDEHGQHHHAWPRLRQHGSELLKQVAHRMHGETGRWRRCGGQPSLRAAQGHGTQQEHGCYAQKG